MMTHHFLGHSQLLPLLLVVAVLLFAVLWRGGRRPAPRRAPRRTAERLAELEQRIGELETRLTRRHGA